MFSVIPARTGSVVILGHFSGLTPVFGRFGLVVNSPFVALGETVHFPLFFRLVFPESIFSFKRGVSVVLLGHFFDGPDGSPEFR